MSLGPDARALVEAAKGGDEPDEGDEARVHALLATRLGAAAATTAAATTGAKGASTVAAKIAATSSTLSMGAKLLLAATIAGSAAFGAAQLVAPPAPAVEVQPSATRVASPVRAPHATPTAFVALPPPYATPVVIATAAETVSANVPPVASLAVPPPPNVATTHATRGASEPRAPTSPLPGEPSSPMPATAPIGERDDVREEAALLRSARAALAAHDAIGALARLEEHARLYPAGVLVEEREAARVLALCSAGRTEEATAAATRFLAAHPRSPFATRVGFRCDR